MDPTTMCDILPPDTARLVPSVCVWNAKGVFKNTGYNASMNEGLPD